MSLLLCQVRLKQILSRKRALAKVSDNVTEKVYQNALRRPVLHHKSARHCDFTEYRNRVVSIR